MASGMNRKDPMSDESAEEALMFLVNNAEAAGIAKAHMTYMEHLRKTTLARLRRAAPDKTEAGRDAWARAHPEYMEVLNAQTEAISAHETLFWKRIHAEATIESWRTRASNNRAAGRMT
jgi:hypothetical protein